MNLKLTLQDIADRIAARENLSKKDADNFVRALFEVVQEGLSEDRFAKIKGFGTFKVVPVSERESVNVKTGERIQISGHDKVTFTPDNALKDLINKPFAHFSTVTLQDDIDLNELENIPEEEEAFAGDDAGQAVCEEAQPLVEEQEEEPTAAKEGVDDDSAPDEDSAADAPEVPQVKEPQEEEEAQALVPEKEVADAPVQPEAPALAASEEEEKSEEQPADVLPEEPEMEEKNTPEADADDDKGQPATALAEENPQEERIRYVVREDTRVNWWKFIAIALFTLMLMAMSYYAGYFRVFCPCELMPLPQQSDNVQPLPADTLACPASTCQPVPSDTLKKKQEEEKEMPVAEPQRETQEPEKANSQAKTEKEDKQTIRRKYRITGTRQNYTIARGETLRGIAAHVYGDKRFVDYIIRHNNIPNPDLIAAGTVIRLPEIEPMEE